jgi:20S proteasome alpha/beta subunit
VTVIAYSTKHKIIAADSRSTDGYAMHFTNCKKIFRLKNGAVIGTAGQSDDRDVRALLEKATPRRMPSREQLAALKMEFIGILIFPKGQVFTIDISFIEHESEGEWMAGVDIVTDDFVAVGHGAQFAYGAMEVGATPVEAVRATCRRDTTCALPVQWERIGG